MPGSGYQKTITYVLIAGVANGIAASQAGTANTALTLNGSLVVGGIAVFDTARRVIVTSAGNDSGITFKIVGTDRNGRPQTEIITGATATNAAQTTRDFLTVISITPSGNTASTVTAGTNGVGSSGPLVVDAFVNPASYMAGTVVTGTANYTVEKSLDDLAPAYDLTVNSPTWYADPTFNAQTAGQNGNISGPVNLIRLTINSGTGSVTLRIIMPFVAGAF